MSAAALANMNAQSRAIAGDEFNQTQSINRERTGLLADEANMTMQQRAAEAAAQADIAKAEIAAAARDADRQSRENIAADNSNLRRELNESDQAFKARQNRANRKVRLRTSAQTAAALGYTDPKVIQKRGEKVDEVEAMRATAVSQAKQYVKVGGLTDPDDLRVAVAKKVPGAPKEVVDYALAAALRSKAGVTAKGQKSAAARYYDYIKRIKSGKA